MSAIEIQLEYFRLNKRLFYADSAKTVKVREMNRLLDYYEDEDKQMNKVLNKFFKKTICYCLCLSYVYDKDKSG